MAGCGVNLCPRWFPNVYWPATQPGMMAAGPAGSAKPPDSGCELSGLELGPQFEACQLEMMIEAKNGPQAFAPHQREG